MASAPRSSGGPQRDAREPAGDGVVWHSTCGYADCVEPSRYAADSTCKGCRRIKYCTRECQKADWKRHKPACKADAAADEAAAREGALVARPRARPPLPDPELLLDAAEDGNLKHVEALLRLGADVNAADEDGVTPLYVASQKGHVAVVAALLAAPDIDVNKMTIIGSTSLLAASLKGHAPVVSALLACSSIDVNAATTDGHTPLHAASERGHAAIVSALLASPDVNVNATTTQGGTPLYAASQNGHATVVSALLAAPGVAVNATITNDYTPLFISSQNGHTAVVSALLAAPGVSVNVAQRDGWTPLHSASGNGRVAIVSALLAHPTVSVNLRTTRSQAGIPAGATPLRLARTLGRHAVAALLEACGGVE